MASSAGFYPEIAAQSGIPTEIANRSSSLRIGVHVGLHRLQCVIWSDQDDQALWSVDMDCSNLPSVSEALLSTRWGERTFRQCLITFDADKICLIPDAFYVENQKSEFLAFQTGEDERDAAKVDIPAMQAKIVYRLPADYQRIQRFFPNAQIIPKSSLLLNYATRKSSATGNHIQFHLTGKVLTMIAFARGEMSLMNTYQVSSAEDILYFMSGAAMRLGIDFSETQLEGYIESDWDGDLVISLLREFSTQVSRLAPATNDNHVFETLFVQCAS
ncbi:MAG: DUF3822 family protein [Flavobacteriales bacterium]